MDLTQLANLGEFIGGVAVLVTLIYLAVQVRHNTHAIMVSTEISGADNVLGGYLAMAQNGELAEILIKGGAEYDSLSRTARFQFRAYWQGVVISHQNYFFLREQGALSAEVWGTYSRQFGALREVPGVSQWWKEARTVFDPRFAAYFDTKLLAHETVGQEQ